MSGLESTQDVLVCFIRGTDQPLIITCVELGSCSILTTFACMGRRGRRGLYIASTRINAALDITWEVVGYGRTKISTMWL